MKRDATETLVACVIEFLDICSFKMDMSEREMRTSVHATPSKIFLAACREKIQIPCFSTFGQVL